MNPRELSSDLDTSDIADISSAGIDVAEKMRSGSFLQQDSQLQFSRSLIEGVEILGIDEALKQSEIKSYFGSNFKLLDRECPQDTEGGYFIRVKKKYYRRTTNTGLPFFESPRV